MLSMGYLRENDNGGPNLLLDNIKYRDRDLVLIDESHNFRYPRTQRYKILEAFLATGRRCCFLTATPRNKTAWDVYHQIKLFHQDDKTDLPIDPPNLKEYFRLIEKGERQLPDLLSNILIRRTRNHILRWYGFDSDTHRQVDPTQFQDYLSGRRRAYVMVGGRHQFFPKRVGNRSIQYRRYLQRIVSANSLSTSASLIAKGVPGQKLMSDICTLRSVALRRKT